MDKLFQSVQIGDTDAFNRYVEKKNPDELNTPDISGTFLIHYAVDGGFLDICQTLVEKKASINVANRQDESPLHIAAKKQYTDICAFLIEKGAILDSKV
mgnify:CR=1 FL=1